MPDPAKARSGSIHHFSGFAGNPTAQLEAARTGMNVPPAVTLPKGGGALKGIGEKFAANPVTGLGSLTIPIPASPGRGGFSPEISLSYNSGSGNGPFGLGWGLSMPSITRKTEKGLPRYLDEVESDVFILSGAEDLVPELKETAGRLQAHVSARIVDGAEYRVYRYRPRIEGLFARIERWTRLETGETHWRSISPENVITLYGTSAASRISDPADPTRIFSWLISETRDDRGNAAAYEYRAENSEAVDLSQAHEKNRTEQSRSAARYLKRIRYGNRVSHLVEPDLSPSEWMFEVVFDYGEHDSDRPVPHDSRQWLCRRDPFSSYRSGFEVRTYRLCQRVLVFHHFPDEPGMGNDCLVRSVDFTYRAAADVPDGLKRGEPAASFLASVTQSGYRRRPEGSYLRASMPALEFSYSDDRIRGEVRELAAESRGNLPDPKTIPGLWVDLDGEGVPGMLFEQQGAWFYNRNLGDGLFAAAQSLAVQPSASNLSGAAQFMDLAGDGQLDAVQLKNVPGFFERSLDQAWEPFASFASFPNIRWDDSNVRLVDLTGDGHADILIAEGGSFTWYPSRGEEGFGPSLTVAQSLDEEKGPRLVFADGVQSVYLADMSGDGLNDLVRIKNGEVCYWPNLGYGRFGPKVAMDDAPLFDRPDQFEQGRIRLGDIDGSGTADLFYIGRDGMTLWRNQCGNRWGEPQRIAISVPPESLATMAVLDLLGHGTACLVWFPSPKETASAIRYVEFMEGEKPHLLVRTKNNMGAETVIQYAPSTRFYLADSKEGRPWITRLPFPVHVVERVESRDAITGNRFVTRYAYHHGYFDGEEREFRGFGMVEQWDTEDFPGPESNPSAPAPGDAVPYVPPALIRTWFHTGAYARKNEEGVAVEDSRFAEQAVPFTAIATSSAQSDSGVFELNFRDERYLPFEGAGVISGWKLELNGKSVVDGEIKDFAQFDYDTISDVVLHIRYTAREDTGAFRRVAIAHLDRFLQGQTVPPASPLWRIIDFRREFPTPWQRFSQPLSPDAGNPLSFEMKPDLFPFLTHNRTIHINQLTVLAQCGGGNYEAALDLPDPAADIPLALTQVGNFGKLHFAEKGDLSHELNSPQTWTFSLTKNGGPFSAGDVENLTLILGYRMS